MATKTIFCLSDRIRLLPVIPGSGHFARVIRQRILTETCDCVAVALPPEFQVPVEQGIKRLPNITLCSKDEPDGAVNYVPIDPAQPIVMALRIAQQEGIARSFVDWSVASYETRHQVFPDSFALAGMSYEKFSVSVMPYIKSPLENSQHDKRVRWMAYQLHKLEMDYRNLVLICSYLDWPWIKRAYDERMDYVLPESSERPVLHSVEKDTLFFALSELPYITYLYEHNRQEFKSDRQTPVDGVKAILLRAKKLFVEKHKLKYHNLTSQTLQTYLQYVRNLTLLEGRLTPDLYTLVTAAKQVSGDSFAISLVEAARDYPYQNKDDSLESIALGIDKANFGDDRIATMKNRLSETQYVWRNLNLKKEPDLKQKFKWKYNWDPYGQCSWPPEDDKIENLNTHVREQAKLLLNNDLARSEKFSTSVKDGIDIRETVRHWYDGSIYVKEIPPSRGKVEIVVFLFDPKPDPNRYTWRQTWYAEHTEESTLCFFATPYMDKITGPGVAQSNYGGCMMIFPPRPIPNVWSDHRLIYADTLEEKLLEAAFFHSKCRHVTIVSPTSPQGSWRRLSRIYKKHIVHIPLHRFSNQTIEKVRRFHVLNGKEIRSFATRFIDEV